MTVYAWWMIRLITCTHALVLAQRASSVELGLAPVADELLDALAARRRDYHAERRRG